MFKNKSTFILTILILFYILLSYGRNIVWHHDVSLWGDMVSKSFWKSRGHNQLGLSYAREGLFSKSEKEYLIAIKLSPYYSHPYNNLAGLYFVMERFEDSVNASRLVLKLDSFNLAAKNNIAVVYYKHLDRHRDAVTLFKSIIKSSPRERKAYFNLGNVYLLLGDKVQASEMYAKALEIDNTYIEAREALDKF